MSDIDVKGMWVEAKEWLYWNVRPYFWETVSEGAAIPPWLGIANIDMATHKALCVVIPFNVPVALGVVIWDWFHVGMVRVAFGSRHAYAQGRVEGLRAARQMMEKAEANKGKILAAGAADIKQFGKRH